MHSGLLCDLCAFTAVSIKLIGRRVPVAETESHKHLIADRHGKKLVGHAATNNVT